MADEGAADEELLAEFDLSKKKKKIKKKPETAGELGDQAVDDLLESEFDLSKKKKKKKKKVPDPSDAAEGGVTDPAQSDGRSYADYTYETVGRRERPSFHPISNPSRRFPSSCNVWSISSMRRTRNLLRSGDRR